jgi:iron(II)-dependent oxidoreductase
MKAPRIPPATIAGLTADLADAHRHTLSLLEGIDLRAASGPSPECDPPLWSLGHVAWFQERYVLRGLDGADVRLGGTDALFDPQALGRRARWETALPDAEALIRYKTEIRDRLVDRLGAGGEASVEDSYFTRLAVIYEDMQGEAVIRARRLLGLPPPDVAAAPPAGPDAGIAGDVAIPGGVHMLGARPTVPLYMDNEKWGHGYEVAPFSISRVPVTNGAYRQFIDDGGYACDEWWPGAALGWRDHVNAEHPRFWVRDGDVWAVRGFGSVAPLVDEAPVCDVCWYEADAYCRWAGRRLPWEGEWEVAAARAPSPGRETLHGPATRYPWGEGRPSPAQANLDARQGGPVSVHAFADGDSGWGCRQMIGNVWEWTRSGFEPYVGFVADPFADYSQPFFDGRHAVLRGGSWATRGRAVWNTFRGFQPLDNTAAIAGFRTCAL